MIYHDPDDPERGYFHEDEVVPNPAGGFMVADEEDDIAFSVEEADCSLCGGVIDAAATIPLCPGCSRDCEREAREQRAHREWIADGSPR